MSSALNPSLATLASTSSPKRSLAWYLSWGILLVLLAASWKGADMRPLDLWNDSGNMVSYAAEFFPPNFAQWQIYVQEMLVTLQIALWGTALAVVTAVPLALWPRPTSCPGGCTSRCAVCWTRAVPSTKWCSPCCSWWP